MSKLRFLYSLMVISVLTFLLTTNVLAKTSANLIHDAEQKTGRDENISAEFFETVQ